MNAVSHGVCNVVKRIVIIATSVLFFGNVLTTQTKIGTGIALFGTYLYVEMSKKYKSKPKTEESVPKPPTELPPGTASGGSSETVTPAAA